MESQPRGLLSVIIPPSAPIYTSLYRRRDEMKWRDFLPVPKKHRRTRSKARSELGSVGDQGEAGLVSLRPTESTPDLGISASTLPTPSPSTSRVHGSNGTYMPPPWPINPTTHFIYHKPQLDFRPNSIRFWERRKQPAEILGAYH